MSETPRTWLSPQAFDRARDELATLRAEQAAGTDQGSVDDDRRTRRIRKLAELVSAAVVHDTPPDDGVAEPGMVLTVRYEADGQTDQFLMADREELPPGDELWVCSPDSPLGTALNGARAGERRQVPLPDGQVGTVTLVAAVPYSRRERLGA